MTFISYVYNCPLLNSLRHSTTYLNPRILLWIRNFYVFGDIFSANFLRVPNPVLLSIPKEYTYLCPMLHQVRSVAKCRCLIMQEINVISVADNGWCPLFLPDRTRLWPRHEPHQSSGSDPASQEGEGARVCTAFWKGDAPTPGVHHAGKQWFLLFLTVYLFLLNHFGFLITCVLVQETNVPTRLFPHY